MRPQTAPRAKPNRPAPSGWTVQRPRLGVLPKPATELSLNTGDIELVDPEEIAPKRVTRPARVQDEALDLHTGDIELVDPRELFAPSVNAAPQPAVLPPPPVVLPPPSIVVDAPSWDAGSLPRKRVDGPVWDETPLPQPAQAWRAPDSSLEVPRAKARGLGSGPVLFLGIFGAFVLGAVVTVALLRSMGPTRPVAIAAALPPNPLAASTVRQPAAPVVTPVVSAPAAAPVAAPRVTPLPAPQAAAAPALKAAAVSPSVAALLAGAPAAPEHATKPSHHHHAAAQHHASHKAQAAGTSPRPSRVAAAPHSAGKSRGAPAPAGWVDPF
jgi:hypothetical protein